MVRLIPAEVREGHRPVLLAGEFERAVIAEVRDCLHIRMNTRFYS
jgi:hypothetical protein